MLKYSVDEAGNVLLTCCIPAGLDHFVCAARCGDPEPDPGAFKCGVSDNYGKALEEIKSERDVYFILKKRFTYEKDSYFYDDGSCFSWNDGAG
jgi:hypothetical protein